MKKEKLLKRGLASLLAVVLVVGMLPMMPGNMATVKAADGDKTIAGLGTGMIADPTVPSADTDAWKGSYVYFGTYGGNSVKYRVLDSNTTVFGGKTMLLDCDSILETHAFDEDGHANTGYTNANEWAGSDIRTYLNGTFLTNTNNFSAVEQSAIAPSTKSTAYSGTDGADGNGWDGTLSYASLSNDKIFFLDAKEATNTSYGYSNTNSGAANRKKTGGNAYWWLRSAFPNTTNNAGRVFSGGNISLLRVNSGKGGVSPAFNINLSSVLFSSVISGTKGETGAEYKLTLLDNDMTIAGNGNVSRSGDTVTVPYTIGGTNSGSATQVSVLILDKEYTAGNTNGATVLAYEKLAVDSFSVTGTGTFTLPAELLNKTCGTDYYAYIIAEDVNGEKETDYASTPVSITVPASKYTVTVTNGSGSGQYAQGETVTITASAAPSGQQFKEWEIVSGNITLASSTSETTSFTMPAEEVSVKAIYEAVPVTEYTITATAGANGTISPNGAVRVTAGGSQTFTISPSSGYVIDSLKVDGLEVTAATSYTFSDINANHTIEAAFKVPASKYTVTVTNGSGSGQYAQGETVTITASAAPSGQQFKEWEIVSGNITLASSTSETTSFTMPAEEVSVKAIYEAVPVTEYTITATAGANGTISPNGAVRVTAGGSQTFTISPSSGYVIDSLKVDGLEVTAATNYTFSDINANHTIEAAFKQESQTPVVTVPSITTQPGNATVKVGETATFTIAATGTDLTYQWQIDRNDGNGWVNIAGATATSYTTSTVDISCNGFKYQCVVSNLAGTVTSNTAVLTVTENSTPDPDPIDYNILDGANSSWTQNSDGSLSIRGSGAFSKFVGVKVDGSLVDAKNYTVKEGSTIVTLKADYLNTLSVGTHTFEILWTDGSASTTFNIKADTSDDGNNNQQNDAPDNGSSTVNSPDDGNKKDDVPKTGDNTPVAWLFILSILSGTGLIITAKKRRVNPDSSKR